jgi:O-antigen ligase
MTTATMSMSHPRSEPWLERATLALLLCFVASLQISIAAANILGSMALVCWIAQLVQDRTLPSVPRFFWPLLAYAGATLVSSAFSQDVRESFIDDKQLLLFIIVPAVYQIARGDRAALVVDVIVSVGAASAAYGIVQYGLLHYDNLGRRPEGAMSHYMTYSGLLMLVIGTALARVLFGRNDRMWSALVIPALAVAVAFSFSRNAGVGACAAAALLLFLKDRRLLALLPVVAMVFVLLAPASISNRYASIFSLKNPTNRDRVAMLREGVLMIKAHPLVGIGPNMVQPLYAQYRVPEAVNPVNPHLHNVPIQIAAERGLPALAVWLWFIAGLVVALWKRQRDPSQRFLAAVGLSAVVSMLAAGMFEYNFGDSEFLMLFLILITLPFAAARTLTRQPLT